MIQLIVKSQSVIDENLEAVWESDSIEIDDWLSYLKSLTYVKDAEWIDRLLNPYTLITFESEERELPRPKGRGFLIH
jgi:hypothetical protein